ncbi:DNA polymerase V subunit [Pantoea brenneri]|uniref:DNA polymerase V subunit n=1 Tax=Pantoea brenneri TaxID=472694 RepID=UPI00289F0AFE|nr:DNA polymerase V subunit [Pantoea brenneri]
MPQPDEIYSAFCQVMRRSGKGGWTVSTRDFVAELKRRNWPHSLRAANQWIEIHITLFRDISIEAGDYRLFELPDSALIPALATTAIQLSDQPDR